MLLDGTKAVAETSICWSDSYEVVRIMSVHVAEAACI
jgi:hypothetical protein